MHSNAEKYQDYSILFVDDEVQSLKYFEKAYSKRFNILTASDTESAIELLEQPTNRIAVLMTDKRMPQHNGIDLLRWTKKHKPNIVRLLTTAHTELEDTIQAINDGEIYRYVPKPWQLDRLLQDLNNAMARFIQLHNSQMAVESQKEVNELAHKSAANLAGHIAHELRTPLLNIQAITKAVDTYLPRLVENFKQQDAPVGGAIPENKLNALFSAPETILNNLKQANVMIDNLLANISQEHIRTDDFCNFSARHCIEAALDDYPTSSHLKEGVYLNLKTDFTIFGSEHLIKHVIFNLLSNAFHAITNFGSGEIHISLESGLDHNYLHFKDTGPGIPEAVIPFIFNEYFSTKPSGKGTGLGLPFCKRVMTALGGNIYCFSQPGEYTEFMLRFPKQQDETKTPPAIDTDLPDTLH